MQVDQSDGAENSVGHLEVDSNEDRDSALGDERSSITTSVTPSVTDYRHENGRRYHAFEEDAYYLPNDEIEAERLDLQHHVWKLTFDGGFGLVPMTDKIKNVLDVGTGTGVWAVEFADAHPQVQIIGTDLSPIQPVFVPPNCQFLVDNCEHDWAYDHKFDYIHARMLTLGVHDWPRFFQQAWDNLEPGGWLETQEVQFPPHRVDSDKRAPRDSALIRWGERVYEAAAKAGINARASLGFTELLQHQGFVNIEQRDVQWAVGAWPRGRKNKVIGRLTYENTQAALPAIALALWTRHLGMSKEEVEKEVESCKKDVDDKATHYYYPMCLHRAQKPMET